MDKKNEFTVRGGYGGNSKNMPTFSYNVNEYDVSVCACVCMCLSAHEVWYAVFRKTIHGKQIHDEKPRNTNRF